MADINQTAFKDQSSIMKGNVSIIGGKWTTQSTNTSTPVAIDTEGSKVLAAGLTRGTVSSFLTSEPTMQYSTVSGMITITPHNRQNDAGRWWAIVQL